jgi:hypothetical protein
LFRDLSISQSSLPLNIASLLIVTIEMQDINSSGSVHLAAPSCSIRCFQHHAMRSIGGQSCDAMQPGSSEAFAQRRRVPSFLSKWRDLKADPFCRTRQNFGRQAKNSPRYQYYRIVYRMESVQEPKGDWRIIRYIAEPGTRLRDNVPTSGSPLRFNRRFRPQMI